MNNPKFDIVLFDADETLFDFKQSEKVAITKTLYSYHIDATPEIISLYSKINLSYWKQFEKGKITRDKLKTQRFLDLFAQLSVKIDPVCFNDEYLTNLSNTSFMLDGAETLVKSLYNDFKLYIATNGLIKAQKGRLSKSPIQDYIEKMFISEEIGYQKPQTEFFDHIFKTLEITDRSRTIILGDSTTSDMQGGKNAGITTCLFDPGNTDTSGLYDYKITSLADFPNILYETDAAID